MSVIERKDDSNKDKNNTTIRKKADSDIIVALAGNPNVGKSTLFNSLTGMRQHTGNWAGKTVENAQGYAKSQKHGYVFVDIPGTYSLIAHSKEEEVARDFLKSKKADITVVVCDATCLERNLNLVLQCIEISERVLVVVNMMDEAKRKGISIDFETLSHELRVEVIGISAREKSAASRILDALDATADISPNKHNISSCEDPKNIISRCEQIARRSIIESKNKHQRDMRLDRIFTSKLSGFPIMFLLLLLIFWITVTGANYPSALLSQLFLYFEDKLDSFLSFIRTPIWLHSLFIDGVYRVLSWVVSVMLPPMAIFFPLFTMLEDLGYLPRIAYNLDKPFKKCNACGKQALTLCMGFGCNAVGVTGARIIDSKRERLLSILTNNFVPCNGRFPSIIAVITMFFAVGTSTESTPIITALYLGGVILLAVSMTFLITYVLSRTLLRGESSSYTLELPPYRRPQLSKIIVRSVFDRTLFVLGRAVSVAIPAGIIIFLLANISVCGNTLLGHMALFLDPIGKVMGLDGVILLAFILGFPANEIVLPLAMMAYMSGTTITETGDLMSVRNILVSNGWDLTTAVCFIIFSLFHFPCSTTLITVKKETGSLRWTFAAFAIPTIVGAVCCMCIYAVSCLF